MSCALTKEKYQSSNYSIIIQIICKISYDMNIQYGTFNLKETVSVNCEAVWPSWDPPGVLTL